MTLAEPNRIDPDSGLGGPERPKRSRAEEEQAVTPLLARANLLRMRGQWDEAVAVCTEALRHAPASATAHSLLGDIYEAQGKLDDALQWFGMAVDLAPERTTDREKLDRVVQAQRAKLRMQEQERAASFDEHRRRIDGKLDAPAGSPPGASGGRVAAERTIEWFDRIFPPGRSESIARLIFVMSGVIAVLIVAAAVFVYAVNNRGGAVTTSGDDIAASVPSLTAPSRPVTVEVPSPPPAVTAAPPAAQQAVPLHIASATSSIVPSPADSSAELRQHVGHLLSGSGIQVTVLQLDERSQSRNGQLEITIPAVPGESVQGSQERVVRAAAVSGRTLALADTSLQMISLRVLLRPMAPATPASAAMPSDAGSVPALTDMGTPDAMVAPSSSDVPIFAAEASAVALRAVEPTIMPTATLLGQFTNVLWQVPQAPETAQPGPAATGAASTTSS